VDVFKPYGENIYRDAVN